MPVDVFVEVERSELWEEVVADDVPLVDEVGCR